MPKPKLKKKILSTGLPSVDSFISSKSKELNLKELNLAVKDAIPNTAPLEIKKKTKSTTPVTSNTSTKVLRNLLGTIMPDQAAQFLSAISTEDNKLGLDDLTPDIKEALIKSIENAKKRTGKTSGGTQYIDFGPDVDEAFQGMKAGAGKMLSIDPATQAASMVGRVSYKENAKGETEVYDSYDFSKTDPDKADSFYKKIRHYAGEVLPDEGKEPNLIGIIPAETKLAFGTNQDGIMRSKMNPRKKYGNGSNSGGVTTSGIPSPAATLNDYNIMMAKAEHEAATNKWLPIVAMVGSLAQKAIGMGAGVSGTAGTAGANSLVEKEVTPVATNKIMATNEKGVTAANGMNNVQADVEVEGGEVYETPQGQVGRFKGPSHAEGGIPLEVTDEPVANPNEGQVQKETVIFSKDLKLKGKSLADRKETRERQIANLEKSASAPYLDSAQKNALQRRMASIQKEEASDLAFQEQVNNMQAMADTMVKAFGTGMAGIKKYGGGTNKDGIQVDEFGNPITEPIVDLESMTMTPGVVGTAKPVIKKYATVEPKPEAPDYMKNLEPSPTPTFANNFGEKLDTPRTDFGAQDFLDSFDPKVVDAQNDSEFYTPGQVGTAKTNTTAKKDTTALKGKVAKALEDNIPTVGDMTKLIGNYLGMTAGIKTATEQRASDITHQNTFANAGKESQTYLDKAMANIEGMKTNAEMKATTASRSSKFSANNSARGVNQRRAMDFLYDQGLAENMAAISANAANQIADIFKTKGTVALSADQLKGTGQYQADMANEAAKDAYYTALGLGRKDFATGLQQTGKDLNDMKENKIIEGLMKDYGTYFIGDKSGLKAKTFDQITGGKASKESTSKTDATDISSLLKSMNLKPDAKGYITLPDGTKILEKELLQKYSKQ